MEWQILTTFFAFISLTVTIVMFTRQDVLAKKLDHYVDVAMGHTESLRTIISILQQLEAKQDLMFHNAPPVPGEIIKDPIGEDLYWETSIAEEDGKWFPGAAKKRFSTKTGAFKKQEPIALPAPIYEPSEKSKKIARKALKEHKLKVAEPKRKRGRPKKAPGSITLQIKE